MFTGHFSRKNNRQCLKVSLPFNWKLRPEELNLLDRRSTSQASLGERFDLQDAVLGPSQGDDIQFISFTREAKIFWGKCQGFFGSGWAYPQLRAGWK